jgi:hypothetical protein
VPAKSPEVAETGKLSIANTVDYAPFEYLDADGKPVVLKSTDAMELWGLSGTPKSPKTTLLATRGVESGEWQTIAKAIPFTPLFAFPGDRREALAAAAKKAKLRDPVKSGVTIPPLFADLTQTPATP